MQQRSTRTVITTRIIRPGQDVPPDDDWLDRTVEERIEGVWTLTKLCHAWGEEGAGELRLDKSVSRILRDDKRHEAERPRA